MENFYLLRVRKRLFGVDKSKFSISQDTMAYPVGVGVTTPVFVLGLLVLFRGGGYA
jgi:hypothetical protein